MVDVPYTLICNATGSTSKIDHLVVSDNMFRQAISCNIIDNALHSDHVSVSIVFDLDINYAALSEWNHSVRAAWYKATSKYVSNYKTDLENRLNNLWYNKDIFLCDNVFLLEKKFEPNLWHKFKHCIIQYFFYMFSLFPKGWQLCR